MPKETKKFKIDNYSFAGGMNSYTSPVFMRADECELIQNYHLDKLGSLTKRNGTIYLIGQVIDGVSINGMYFFNDAWGTDYSNVLVACDDAASPTNSDIRKITADSWAYSLQDDTAGAKPEFTTFIDYVFRTNGSEVMKSSTDLETWGTTNCLATLIPKYTCVWEDRAYALNDNSATKYPSRIYWSTLPSGTPLAITWNASTQMADINPDDNDYITWGEPFGKMMLIFKSKGMYRWTFGQVEPDKIINVGTPQGRTVKQTQGICFFANEYGIWAYNGSGLPKLISKKIQNFIDNVSDWSAARAEVDEDHYFLSIGNVTVDGKTYSNAVLVYTISLRAWHLETYPFTIKSMARFQRKTLGTTEIYDSIYLGDNDGFIYRKETGTTDYLGTTAKPINGNIVTKENPLPNFPKTSELDNCYFLASKGGAAKVHFNIDRGEWKEWKNLVQRITEAKIAGRARTLQFSITDNSTSTSQIEGFSVEMKPELEPRRP